MLHFPHMSHTPSLSTAELGQMDQMEAEFFFRWNSLSGAIPTGASDGCAAPTTTSSSSDATITYTNLSA